jgi:hypothetical protein
LLPTQAGPGLGYDAVWSWVHGEHLARGVAMTGPGLNGASNDPDDYDTTREPHPDIDAEGTDSDMGTGLDDERELGGEAKVDAPMP